MPNPYLKSEDLTESVGHARIGVESAMEELVRRYQERIAGFIYSLVGHEEAIADLSHGVFVKMILGIKQLREAESFES